MNRFHQLRPLVEQSIAEEFADHKHPDFWYPLARPSYGADEVMQALDSMLTFKTTMWEKTREFELEFAKLVGAESVMVNSGSSADLLLIFSAMESCGGPLKTGDEILVPAVTWPTHLWSVAMAGLTPVLVDIDPMTLNFDFSDLKRKVSHKTKGVFPVHLMGNPVNMDELSEVATNHNLLVFEDCCESLGAKWSGSHVGSTTYGGTFSFFFSHHICTMEGGMITTPDPEVAERLRLLRAHGWARNIRNQDHPLLALTKDDSLDPRYTFLEWGFNVRPTELQAGFGLEQLRKFGGFQAARDTNFALFQDCIQSYSIPVRLPEVHPKADPSWFSIPMLLDTKSPITRDSLASALQKNGIETRPIVAGNLALQPVRRRFPWLADSNLPGASTIHRKGLYIGLHPVTNRSEIERIVGVIQQVFNEAS